MAEIETGFAVGRHGQSTDRHVDITALYGPEQLIEAQGDPFKLPLHACSNIFPEVDADSLPATIVCLHDKRWNLGDAYFQRLLLGVNLAGDTQRE